MHVTRDRRTDKRTDTTSCRDSTAHLKRNTADQIHVGKTSSYTQCLSEPLHCGSEQPCIEMKVLGHLLICLLAPLTHSHCLLCSAALIYSFAQSFIPKLVRKWMVRCLKTTWFCLTALWSRHPSRHPLKSCQWTNILSSADLRPRTLVQISQMSQQTMGQKNEKSRFKYWATCSFVSSLAWSAHSLSCSTLLPLLSRYAELISLLTCSPTQSWACWKVSDWCWVISLFWTIVQHLILYFPTSLGVSLGAVRANERTDKAVTQYLRLDFLLFWTTNSWWCCPKKQSHFEKWNLLPMSLAVLKWAS